PPRPENPQIRRDVHGDPLPEGAIERLGSLHLRHAGLSSFVMPPGAKTMVSAGSGIVRYWDIGTGRQLREVHLRNAASGVSLATLTADGKIVAGLHQKQLVFWDADSGNRLKAIGQQPENAAFLRFSPDGKTLANGTWNGTVALWDWQEGKARPLAL